MLDISTQFWLGFLTTPQQILSAHQRLPPQANLQGETVNGALLSEKNPSINILHAQEYSKCK